MGHQELQKYEKDTPSLHTIECEQKLHCVPNTTHFQNSKRKENKSLEPTQFPEPHRICRLLLE
jgi:hypothetical protein